MRRSHCSLAALAALGLSLSSANPAGAAPNYALAFNGTSASVDTGTAVVPTSGDFTVEVWVNLPTAPSAYKEILSQGNSGNALYIGTDMTNGVRLGDSWTNTGVAFPVGGWHHLAVVKTSTNTLFFIDGTNRASKGSAIANPSASYGLRLGGQYTGGDYWPGSLDDVRVWNVARNAEEIRTNRFATLTGAETGLVVNWLFDEGRGTNCAAIGSSPIAVTLSSGMRWVPSGVVLPYLQLIGPNPFTNECHAAFTDPGAMACAAPVAIAAGGGHSLALKANSSVVAWGDNSDGQTNVPPTATNIIAIAGGGAAHSLALKAAGTVVAWGNNTYGQTNVPPTATNVVAIAAGIFHSLALKASGRVVAWGWNNHLQTNVPATATNVVAIAGGGYHNLALKADGTVVAWGAGMTNIPYDSTDCGQSIVPSTATNVVAIAAGQSHSLALKADGTIVAWGYNGFSLTNVPVAATNVVAIAAGNFHNLALKADGTVVAWGGSSYGEADVPAMATNVIAIAGGLYYSLALKADGTVVGWGYNGYGLTTVPTSVYNLNLPVGVSGVVDSNTLGPLTYTFTNSLGLVQSTNRTVVAVDTKAPVLTLIGSNPLIMAAGTPLADPGATASDACVGDLTGAILVTSTVNTYVAGSYTLTYTVTDASGNTSMTNRTVWVTSVPSVGGFSASFLTTNGITGTRRVQFNAGVNPNGWATAVFFQYGLSVAYAGSSAITNLAAAFSSSNVAAALDNLAPGAVYHWRVVATNNLGVTTSPDQTLTVPALYARGDFNGDGMVDASEVNTMLSNYWPQSPWLQLTNAAGLGGTNVTFGLTNDLAGAFTVEYSTNLTDWLPLGPATPRYGFTDTNAPATPQRFYRLRWP